MVKRIFSEEHRRNMSKAKKGHKSHRKGKSMEEEYGKDKAEKIKKLISLQTKEAMLHVPVKKLQHNKGKTYEELYGKKKAEEVKKKITPLGRTHSLETRLKMSNSRRIKYQNKKNKGRDWGLLWKSTRTEKLKGAICHNCKSKENLVIHHKDSNTTNNCTNNLMVLCRGCHGKTHTPKGSKVGANISKCSEER